MKRKIFSIFSIALALTVSNAQVELVKKTSENATNSARLGFRFTNLIDLSFTPIESQGASGTCWSYSTNSFLESEMIRKGKKPIHLSKIYTARKAYLEKADAYVRMSGGLTWGDGGESHDVINMYTKYGILPEKDYTGLINGKTRNHFAPMQKKLKAILDSVVAIKGQTKPKAWKHEFKSVLDSELGKVPQTFVYEGKTYTPKSFAKQVVGLDPSDYVEFISQTTTPYYKKAMMTVPDNWAYQWDYNITVNDLTAIVDNALKHGYTVSWGADVSEPYFSWPNGVAFVPENARSLEGKKLTKKQKKALYNGDRAEMEITPDNRQQAIDNNTTTDDHGMHIVGLAKDQDGKEFYIVKNSWGTHNDHNGLIYVSKAYLEYKTTAILVNKKAVPRKLRRKMHL